MSICAAMLNTPRVGLQGTADSDSVDVSGARVTAWATGFDNCPVKAQDAEQRVQNVALVTYRQITCVDYDSVMGFCQVTVLCCNRMLVEEDRHCTPMHPRLLPHADDRVMKCREDAMNSGSWAQQTNYKIHHNTPTQCTP